MAAHRVYFGLPITEVISETSADWLAQKAALRKLLYGLTCLSGGVHTGLIARGSLCDANLFGLEREERVFGVESQFFSEPEKFATKSLMLIGVPPGLWQRLRAS